MIKNVFDIKPKEKTLKDEQFVNVITIFATHKWIK